MDFGAPVAGQATFNPQQPLQTLSALLSLKQQQLSLAQGEQQLKSQAAAATVAQMDAQQYQAASKVNWQSYAKADGSFDTAGATAKMLEIAPNHPEWAERLAQTATAGATAKKAFFDLSQDYQTPIRAAFGTWAADPKSQPSDLAAQLQAISEDAPKSEQGNIDKIIKNTFGVMNGPNVFTGQPKSLQEQKAAALAYSRAGLTPSEVSGPGGTSSPTPTALNTGGAIVPGAVAPAASGTPGAFTPAGKSVPTTISPQVVTQPGTDAKYIVWPNGTVTPLGSAGGGASTTPSSGGEPGGSGAPAAPARGSHPRPPTNWWQPAPGQTQLLHANTAALASRIQAGEQAANGSPAAIDALSRARSILDKGVWTGGGFSEFKDLKNLAASIGVDTGTAQNASELAKNLARYEAARAGSVGSTDAARSLYEAGAPNTKMDANAVKAVVMQSLGVEKMIQGYAKIVGGAPTPQIAQQREQAFRSIPHLVQAYELGFMRNKAEADAFFSRYDVSGHELAQSAQELRQLGAL